MKGAQKRVTLLSLHDYRSKRKVDFHYMADDFASRGWDVIFVTAPLSPFSKIIGDHRWQYTKFSEINKPVPVRDQIIQYTYGPLFSPISLVNNRVIDTLSRFFIPVYRRTLPRNLQDLIAPSDLIIMESNAAIILYDYLKTLCPLAKIIYRADDALETLHVHAGIVRYEKEAAPRFDLVTVPSSDLFNRFAGNNVRLLHHAIEKSLFEEPLPCPASYSRFEKNLFFVGVAHLDVGFLRIAAEQFPGYGFHIIGPLSLPEIAPNVIAYGEMPHHATIPFLKHADAGLHTLRTAVGLQTYSDSMKVIQYTWCRLPIIAPSGIPSDRKHFIYYEYDNVDSIKRAINTAVQYDRDSIDRSGVHDWNEFVQIMLDEVSL
jgi:2-beta-glucuronyltransferase